MKRQNLTRRLILIGAGASLASVACGDSDGDGESGSGASGSGASGSGGSSSGGSSSGGSSSGGSSSGGSSAGGSSAGGSGGMGGGSPGVCGGALLVMGSNYDTDPHDLSIPLQDLIDGVTKTYTTTATNHDHDITITAEEFTALRDGATVKKYVCFDELAFEDHEFVISCDDPSVMPTFEGEFGTPGNCPST